MRVLGFGSRTLRDPHPSLVIVAGYKALYETEPLTIIQGGQSSWDPETRQRYGGDYLWCAAAVSHHVEQEVYPANWRVYGRRAGYIRNAQQLREGRPEVCWGVVDRHLKDSPGSANMAKLALEAGKPVYVVQALHAMADTESCLTS